MKEENQISFYVNKVECIAHLLKMFVKMVLRWKNCPEMRKAVISNRMFKTCRMLLFTPNMPKLSEKSKVFDSKR